MKKKTEKSTKKMKVEKIKIVDNQDQQIEPKYIDSETDNFEFGQEYEHSNGKLSNIDARVNMKGTSEPFQTWYEGQLESGEWQPLEEKVYDSDGGSVYFKDINYDRTVFLKTRIAAKVISTDKTETSLEFTSPPLDLGKPLNASVTLDGGFRFVDVFKIHFNFESEQPFTCGEIDYSFDTPNGEIVDKRIEVSDENGVLSERHYEEYERFTDGTETAITSTFKINDEIVRPEPVKLPSVAPQTEPYTYKSHTVEETISSYAVTTTLNMPQGRYFTLNPFLEYSVDGGKTWVKDTYYRPQIDYTLAPEDVRTFVFDCSVYKNDVVDAESVIARVAFYSDRNTLAYTPEFVIIGELPTPEPEPEPEPENPDPEVPEPTVTPKHARITVPYIHTDKMRKMWLEGERDFLKILAVFPPALKVYKTFDVVVMRETRNDLYLCARKDSEQFDLTRSPNGDILKPVSYSIDKTFVYA